MLDYGNELMCTSSSSDNEIVPQHDANSLLIQHDWNEVKNGEKFFLGFRKFGEKSNFINVIKAEGLIESGLSDAKIEALSQRKIRVNCAGCEEKIFIAPSVELRNIHNAAVNSIDLSPSGNLIVSGDSEGVLSIWNARTGEIKKTCVGHIMDINKCRFFPSGMQVASCSIDMTVRIWPLMVGEANLNSNGDLFNSTILKGHTRAVLDLAIIDDGKRLVSVSKDGTTKQWDCVSGKCLHTLSSDSSALNSIAVGDMCTVACGSKTGRVSIYDLTESENVYVFFVGSSCTCLHFSGDTLFCGTEIGEIHCFSISTRKTISILKTSNGRATKLSWCSLGLLASFGDGTLLVFPQPLVSAHASVEYTGNDMDPILDFAHSEEVLFSACRDKTIRKYHLK